MNTTRGTVVVPSDETHTVQFIADDLGVALVVVPVGYCELQRPEQAVVDLHKEHFRNVNTTRQRLHTHFTVIHNCCQYCDHSTQNN